MCGIVGWVSFDRDLRGEAVAIQAMTDTMACRGPDDNGTWLDRHVALGHRRLAVIDLAGGAQPMTVGTPNGPIVMVYSGEVYNFAELRQQLQAQGHAFRTNSDTEVVLRGYMQWGEAVAERCNGMFAFAIWDTRNEKLVLVRDRMGIKPLFLYPTPSGAFFGSEPKAILANALAERVVDADGLRQLFSLAKISRHTIWKGMTEVEPGTVVIVDDQGIRERTYWRLETRDHTDGPAASVAKTRELLEDIVERQLVADVPRCVLLSGGLDSSALTALAADHLRDKGEKLCSFAVEFAGQDDNFIADELRSTMDAPFVRDVATKSGTDHYDITLDSARLADPDVRRAVITARDIPFSIGDMDASLYLLFEAIREHSTVALSGESADELFGGYLWFHNSALRQPDTFPWLAAVKQYLFGDIQTIFTAETRTALALPAFVQDNYRSAISGIARLDGESDHEFTMRKISYLHLTCFVRYLLERKDRLSMAVGLEVRVPFCDHRLVEYVYNTPWALKTYDHREKSLLRGAVSDRLPQSVVERAKSPYPSTHDPRYMLALREQARTVLSDPSHPLFDLIDIKWLRCAVDRQEQGEDQRATRHGLERTLDLALWMDIYSPRVMIP